MSADLAARPQHRQGYWNKVEETEATFHNKSWRIALRPGSHADGVGPDTNWMATGDYGVWLDGGSTSPAA